MVKKQELLYSGTLFFTLLAFVAIQEPALGQYGSLAGAASGLIAALLLWYGLKLQGQERSVRWESNIEGKKAEQESWDERLNKLETALNELRTEMVQEISAAKTEYADQFLTIKGLLEQLNRCNEQTCGQLKGLNGFLEDSSKKRTLESEAIQTILARLDQTIQEDIQKNQAEAEIMIRTVKEESKTLEDELAKNTAATTQALEDNVSKLLDRGSSTQEILNQLVQEIQKEVQNIQTGVETVVQAVHTDAKAIKESAGEISEQIMNMMLDNADSAKDMEEQLKVAVEELQPELARVSGYTEEMAGYIGTIKREIPKIESQMEQMQEDAAQLHGQMQEDTDSVKVGLFYVQEELSKLGPVIKKQSETCLEIAGIYREVTSEDRKILQEILGGNT